MRTAKRALLAVILLLGLSEAAARLLIARRPPSAARCPWSESWWRLQALGHLAARPYEGALAPPLVYDAALGWRASSEGSRASMGIGRGPGGLVALDGSLGWDHRQMLSALDRELSREKARRVRLVWSDDQSLRAGLAYRDAAKARGGAAAPLPWKAERELRSRSRLLLLLRAALDLAAGPPPPGSALDADLSALRERARAAGAEFSVVFEPTPGEPLDGREAAVARAACARLALSCEFRKNTGTGARTVLSPARHKAAAAKRRA